MKFLIVDVETTGLDPEKDTVTELGMVLCDMETKTPLVLYNELINDPNQPPIREEITDLTGITQEMIDNHGIAPEEALRKFVELAAGADAVLAHNAPFDRGMIEVSFSRLGETCPEFQWIDSCVDVPYPASIKTRTLTYLAAEHKFVNPLSHRALFDCMTTFEVIKHYDPGVIYEMSLSPNVWVQCETIVPWKDPAPEGKKQNDLAKAIGFRFDGQRKIWSRQVKECMVDDLLAEAGELGLSAFRL